MALLDVSSVLVDPDLVDTFNVRRRAQTVDGHGWAGTNDQTFEQVVGVVTAISPSDLDRKEDYQTASRSISIVTQFRLQTETTDRQPDIVVWRGSNFVVKHIDPYPQFGTGFYQVECSSMDKTDGAFDPPASGQTAFNLSNNAVFAAMVTTC